MSRPTRSLVHALACALGLALALAASPTVARAYSSADRFDQPVADPITDTWGGGGGRRFTGSPADGFTCTVCHVEAAAPVWSVLGLPGDGYVPDDEYELEVTWPPEARQTALALEVVDAEGAPAGDVALVPEAELTAAELCGGEPAARRFPALAGRTVVATDACGASRVRVRWTAPAGSTGPVWLHASIVQGDLSGTPFGDSSATFVAAMEVQGAPTPERAVTRGCAVDAPEGGHGLLVAFAALLLRRRRTGRAARQGT